MKRLARANEMLIIGLGSILLTIVVFTALFVLGPESNLRLFFHQGWAVQATSTALFFVALFFILFRYRDFGGERQAGAGINIQTVAVVTYEFARQWLGNVPPKYRDTLVYRRVGELLRGFLNQEEIFSLSEELSRRDHEQVERGHQFLGVLRELIPVVGFLGTVLGLSLGMIKFPELVKDVAQMDSLKTVLKDFAASLSIAFNTTLLALAYTIVVVILGWFLRKRDETYVAHVDAIARDLLVKLKVPAPMGDGSAANVERLVRHTANAVGRRMQEGLNECFQQWSVAWQQSMTDLVAKLTEHPATDVGDLVAAMQRQHEEVVETLEAIRDGLHEPPRYEIRVQPIRGEAA